MMTRVLRFAALTAFALGLAAAAVYDIPLSEHAARRAALRKALPDGAIVTLEGGTENERGGLRSPFFQEPNFLYLTGWREPGARLILAAEGEFLFIPKRNDIRDRYTGRKAAPDDANARTVTGFENVLESEAFAGKLKELAAAAGSDKGDRPVYWLQGTPAATKEALGNRELKNVWRALARLRMVKSAAEIARIQRSVDATIDAHLAAWARIKAGLYEYQVAATMGRAYFEQGCERHAYIPIVASGPNAIALHYASNKRRMDAGELLLMDVGAECADYAADITRTVPVNGRFTDRQREIYEIVLGAQQAAIRAAKPGMKLLGTGEDSLNGIAKRYVETHGKDRHGESLGKYYLHSVGHHVGLDVHDPADPDLTLAPGMVVTVEPGIYIAEEGIGVRIEDVVLITENGAKVLSAALPSDPGEVEKRVRAPRKESK